MPTAHPAASAAARVAAAQLEARLGSAFAEVSTVGCLPTPTDSCATRAILIDAAPEGECLGDVLPAVTYRIGDGEPFQGAEVPMSARWTLRSDLDNAAEPVPAILRAPDGELKQLCVPRDYTVNGIVLKPADDALDILSRKERSKQLASIVSGALLGALLMQARTGEGANIGAALGTDPQGSGIVDLLFGSGSNSLVSLEITSEPSGVPIYFGSRKLKDTDTSFSVARSMLAQIYLRAPSGPLFLRDCERVPNGTRLVLKCKCPSRKP